jgi:hypothetical protein
MRGKDRQKVIKDVRMKEIIPRRFSMGPCTSYGTVIPVQAVEALRVARG